MKWICYMRYLLPVYPEKRYGEGTLLLSETRLYPWEMSKYPVYRTAHEKMTTGCIRNSVKSVRLWFQSKQRFIVHVLFAEFQGYVERGETEHTCGIACYTFSIVSFKYQSG